MMAEVKEFLGITSALMAENSNWSEFLIYLKSSELVYLIYLIEEYDTAKNLDQGVEDK